MKTKRSVSVFFVFLIVITLVACNVEETGTDNTESSENTTENINLQTERLSATCDMILASGDGYELVANQTDSYSGSVIEVGVIKNNEWLVPLTTKSPFVTEEGTWRIQDHPYIEDDGFGYMGDGCFVLYDKPKLLNDGSIKINSVIYSAEINVGFYDCDFGIHYGFSGVYQGNSPMLPSLDCESIMREQQVVALDINGRLRLYNLATGTNKTIEGFLTKENFPEQIGTYSEGLFYARGENDTYEGFFNADGQMVINLEEYNASYIVGNDAFENGQVVLRCENPNGIEFDVTINTEGKVIKEERLED